MYKFVSLEKTTHTWQPSLQKQTGNGKICVICSQTHIQISTSCFKMHPTRYTGLDTQVQTGEPVANMMIEHNRLHSGNFDSHIAESFLGLSKQQQQQLWWQLSVKVGRWRVTVGGTVVLIYIFMYLHIAVHEHYSYLFKYYLEMFLIVIFITCFFTPLNFGKQE